MLPTTQPFAHGHDLAQTDRAPTVVDIIMTDDHPIHSIDAFTAQIGFNHPFDRIGVAHAWSGVVEQDMACRTQDESLPLADIQQGGLHDPRLNGLTRSDQRQNDQQRAHDATWRSPRGQ